VDAQIIQYGQLAQTDVPSLGDNVFKGYLVGQQCISKYQEAAKNLVNIYLCLLRLPQYQTEILITMNDPVVINPSSSSAHAQAQPHEVTLLLFKNVLHSLVLKDASVFL